MRYLRQPDWPDTVTTVPYGTVTFIIKIFKSKIKVRNGQSFYADLATKEIYGATEKVE